MMNRFFGGGRDDDKDEPVDPKFINAELRDGIEKELRRSDLTPEDRKSYEDALARLDSEDAAEGEAT